MNNYKEKYQKYKFKYINLKKNIENIGGTPPPDNYNIDIKQNTNTKIKLLKKNKSTYDLSIGDSIIDFNFAENLINGLVDYTIDIDNVLNINIKSEIYYSMNIYNNTLSIPGLSIYLKNSFDDELDVEKIHKLLENKIIGKHILFMPFQKKINGILLKDLAEILELKNVNSHEFILNVELVGQDVLLKLKKNIDDSQYGMININDEKFEYNDYVDMDFF
jgi:hypothetical protein